MYSLNEGKLVTLDQVRKINETETSKISNILDVLLSDKEPNKHYARIAYQNYLKDNK
jgi:hypothetical protein